MRMRRRWLILPILICIAALLLPSVCFTEDRATVRLARTIYALARDESYDTKLAIGSLVMNRVSSGWFSDDLSEVLSDQQQFPSGERYDDESLRAAHAALSGKRTIDRDALYYQASDATETWDADSLCCSVGNYNFYYTNGND